MTKKSRRLEQESVHESLETLEYLPSPINLHLYQPPRILRVEWESRVGTVYDISGARGSFKGFNHQITEESYIPLANKGILSHDQVSWNLYGVTADWLEINYPELISDLQSEIEAGTKPPVGDSYLHIILPFLSSEHKNMLLRISKIVYRQRWGVDPESIWLPESAVDGDTVATLIKNNFKSVHLREHQVDSKSPGNIFKINSGEESILAVVGNNYLSGKVGFDKPWADAFFDTWHQHYTSLGFAPRISVDGETLGHWWKADQGAFEFSKYLLEYLANGNSGRNIDFNKLPINSATLNENTSWSCLDAGLGRWKGSDSCSCELPRDSYHADKVRSSKRDLFEKMSTASTLIDESLDNELPGWRELYIDWFVRQRAPLAKGQPITAKLLGDKYLEKLFLCAYIRDLGWTSCGWFFGDIDGFERQIPANSLKAISEIMDWPEIYPKH